MGGCIKTWHHIGGISSSVRGRNLSSAARVNSQRNRLVRIAFMVSICLLLSVIATLSTSLNLEEWARSADISLTCSLGETWNSRDWATYGFQNGENARACKSESAIGVQWECVTDCLWLGGDTSSFMCSDVHATLSELETQMAITGEPPTSFMLHPCDCPCKELIEVRSPRSDHHGSCTWYCIVCVLNSCLCLFCKYLFDGTVLFVPVAGRYYCRAQHGLQVR
jgi:hypothetical protein